MGARGRISTRVGDAAVIGAFDLPVLTVAVVLLHRFVYKSPLSFLPDDVRVGIYSDLSVLAAFAGATAGLTLTLVLGMNGKTVKHAKEQGEARLVALWLFAVVTPWVVAAGSVVAKALDAVAGAVGQLAQWFVLLGAVSLTASLARMMWVFWRFATADTRDTNSERSPHKLKLVDRAASGS